jgi:site-specific DNA-methyltransferase (adenine-specific)
MERRWIGSEIGDVDPAVNRLRDLVAGLDHRWEKARGHVRHRPSDQLPLLESSQ